MKLNPDCIRDLLLTAEENIGFSSGMSFPAETKYELLTKYSYEETMYHIQQCEMSGFFTKVNWFMGGECYINNISPEGHAFLANIRSENVWNKTKETAKSVGSFSLDTLTKIAVNVVSTLIKNQF